MNTIEELIIEGTYCIDEYQKEKHTEVYSCLKGEAYETWMGKVAIYAEQMPDGIIKNEIQKIYNKRSKYLGTTGAEKIIGVLNALKYGEYEMGETRIMKVFISHSSKDKAYGDVLLELLRGMQLNRDEIIYTSNDLYGIPLGKKIYNYLRDNINIDVHVIFLLSDHYFDSVASMNEMGATWLAQNKYTVIGVPNFDFNCRRFQDCCIDSKEMGLIMDNYLRITEFKGIIEAEFGKRIDDMEWQELLERYKGNLEVAKSRP